MTKKLLALFAFVAAGFFLVLRHEESKAAEEAELWAEAAREA